MVNNVTGWSQLLNGNLILAAYTMYDAALMGWTAAILFFVYQTILYIKTRNVTLCWSTGILFVSLFAVSTFVKAISVHVMFILLVFELAGILFVVMFK